jgi:hypothetical protein
MRPLRFTAFDIGLPRACSKTYLQKTPFEAADHITPVAQNGLPQCHQWTERAPEISNSAGTIAAKRQSRLSWLRHSQPGAVFLCDV